MAYIREYPPRAANIPGVCSGVCLVHSYASHATQQYRAIDQVPEVSGIEVSPVYDSFSFFFSIKVSVT